MNLQRVTARRGMRSNFQSAPLFNKGATCNDTFTDRYAVCLSRWASARIVSDFAGASERTRKLLRQLSKHNDVIAAMVFDPLWQRMPEHRALVVSEGRLQVELRVEQEKVRAPLSSMFKGRTAEVADLLRSSGVPLMALSTDEPTVDQVRRLFGERVRPTTGSGL